MLDGAATGPKTIEIGNWSGKALYSPRATLKGVLKRDEFDFPGIYFLRSESESYEFDESIYIGEAEELRARLKQHIADRDFDSVVCFVSKDEMLTKAHIKYLESRLISQAKEANSSLVENSNNPKPSRISEADVSDMEYFIEQIKLILPTVGMNALVVAAPHQVAPTTPHSFDDSYRIKSKKFDATMIETDGGFVVTAGSQAAISASKSLAEGRLRIRKKLIDACILVVEGDKLRFSEDASFSSPSAAASVVLGRQAPGPLSWVTAAGQAYKDVQKGR
ncbi:GIY-YIG nuclease family protein [Marinobacter sp. 1Y8]